MNEFLFHYHRIHPVTWVYLSSLMMIAVYFKFSRLWSVRNLDLVCLILLSPGLLLVVYGRTQFDAGLEGAAEVERLGFIWLFATIGVLLVRLLVDPLMVRRPLLEANLSVGGQTFSCVALLVFLMANVIASPMTDEDRAGSRLAEQLRHRQQASLEQSSLSRFGPGYPLLFLLPNVTTQTILAVDEPGEPTPTIEPGDARENFYAAAARTTAILSHLAVVIGIVVIGYRHFDNIKTGISAATLYLLLPYTAMQTGRVSHVLPAALLVWAIVAYRRPLAAGMLMGLAIGVIYYPAFLLPLWLGFYWRRGLFRFLSGVASMLAVLVGLLAFTSADWPMFTAQISQMFGLRVPLGDAGGFWQFAPDVYRIPVLAAFIALCGSLAIWPAQKNLGTLLSCSAAVMLCTQFWHAYDGGLYMAWFLPLLLLTIFRPNLEDRVALSVLGEGWLGNRKMKLRHIERAA